MSEPTSSMTGMQGATSVAGPSITIQNAPRNGTPAAAVPADTDGPVSVTREIKWGSIIKGAAIVAGVVLVGVVGFAFVSGLVSGLVGSVAANSAAGLAIEGSASLASTLGGALSTAGNMTLGALGEIGTALFGSSAAVASGATAGVSAATANATGTFVGAIAAGGAVAAAAPLAVKTIATMPTTETIAHYAPPPIAPTGMEDGSLAGLLGAKKKTILAPGMVSTGSAPDSAADMLHDVADIPEIPEEQMANHSSTNAKAAASKAMHHAGHAAEATNERQRTSDMLGRAHDHSRAWVERTRGGQAPATGNFAQQLRPQGTQNTATPIEPRSSNFATQLEHDRAALDMALGQTTR